MFFYYILFAVLQPEKTLLDDFVLLCYNIGIRLIKLIATRRQL